MKTSTVATGAGTPCRWWRERTAERVFFCAMAALMVVTVFVGFYPSFYLKGVVPTPPGLKAMTLYLT